MVSYRPAPVPPRFVSHARAFRGGNGRGSDRIPVLGKFRRENPGLCGHLHCGFPVLADVLLLGAGGGCSASETVEGARLGRGRPDGAVADPYLHLRAFLAEA